MKSWQVRGVLIVLGLLSLSGVGHAQTSASTDALWNDATLYRDAYGTPHIHGASLRGMAFAFGYAQAEDHLETMLMAYRVATGHAAAVGGEPFADGDAFALKIANEATSRTAMAEADGVTRDLCEGFALGINAWIFAHQDEMPAWVEGVQPMDVLAYWHYLMVTSAPFDLPDVYHPERPLQRANAWALAPSKSVEGKTLLVMNPHQHYRAPYQWYEAHLMLGEMNVAGATLIGVPVLMMGHNAHLGWALSPNEADTADFFRENLEGPTPSSNDSTLPTIMAEMAPVLSFMATAKTYHVRTASGLVERSVPSYIGSRGPMLEGANGGLYSWRNGGFGQFGGLQQLMQMAQATDLAAFQNAVLLHQLPSFQLLYADAAGNLFYLYNARTGNKDANLPDDLRRATDWRRPVDATRERFAWDGVITPGNLPNIVNPGAGYLQACGTPPWLATGNSGLDSADWPRWLVPESDSYRVYRVRQILASGRYSLEDMGAMLYDTLVPAAVDMVPLLLSMAERRPEIVRGAHPDLLTGLGLLRNWDFTSEGYNEALAFYVRWWALIKERHLSDFADEAALYRGLLENSPAAQVYALEAATDAARSMRNDFNRLAIPWGELHRMRRGNRDEPVFGTNAGDPIFYTESQPASRGRWQSGFGYGFAMAVEFGATPRAMSIVPFGASENPKSPHYDDQMGLFLNRGMKPTYFTYEDVARNATRGFGRHVVLGVPDLEGYVVVESEIPHEVSLEAVSYPPRPYPKDHVPFTPTVRPMVVETEGKLSWTLSWKVDEAVCSDEHRPRLRFYTYTLEDGWLPLLSQEFDSADDLFTGSGTGAVMIALMGPSAYLRTPEPAEAPEVTEGAPPTGDDAIPPTGAFAANPVEAPVEDSGEQMPAAPVSESDSVTPEAPADTTTDGETMEPTPTGDPRIEVEYVGVPGADGNAANEAPRKKGLGGLLKKLRNEEKN